MNSYVCVSALDSFLSARRCTQRVVKPWNRLPRVIEEPYWAEEIQVVNPTEFLHIAQFIMRRSAFESNLVILCAIFNIYFRIIFT